MLTNSIDARLTRAPSYTLDIFALKIAAASVKVAETMIAPEEIRRRIVELEIEHRDLDAAIHTMADDVRHDELQLRRLKKRKLQLKDNITLLKMQLVPDLPA